MKQTVLQVVLAVVLIGLGAHWLYEKGVSDSDAKWSLKLSEANAEANRIQREKEHAYQDDLQKLQDDMQARMADVSAASDRATRNADSLQKQLDDTRSKLRAASKAAELAGVNQGAAEAALVLSELYSASITELRRVAETADIWHEQLVGCNEFYEKVKAR